LKSFKQVCLFARLLILLGLSFSLYANTGTHFSYPDYRAVLDLSGQENFLIIKGDNPVYKEPAIDESRWKAVSLPSTWGSYFKKYSGICWYRTHITFPSDEPVRALGVRLGKISDADEVYFNGALIGKSGQFPPHQVSAYDKKRLYEIPVQLIRPGEDNVLAVRVQGLFEHNVSGLYEGPFEIGPYAAMLFHFYTGEFIPVFTVLVYIVISLYFLVIFINRSFDREYLFFSIFAFVCALYLSFWSQWKYFLFPGNFLFFKKIEYILVQAIVPLLLTYVLSFYKKRLSRLHYLYFGLSLIGALTVLFTSNVKIWYTTVFYIAEPVWGVVFAYMLYVSYKELKVDRKAWYIIALLIVMITVMVNDTMVIRNIYRFWRISHAGFFAVIVGTAYLFRKRMIFLRSQYTAFRDTPVQKKISLSDDARSKVEKAIEYIQTHYQGEISRENLAASIGLHHDYLGKLFKHYTGKKINEYINTVRIRKATGLLDTTDKTVTEIAFESGFESLPTFYRAFQSIKKMKPSDYADRKKRKQTGR
jgi:AraC-like DNA-binding protein